MIKDQKWFENKVKEYHGDKVTVVGEYNGSEKPIEVIYHCKEHGDTITSVNAKNVCKPFFLPCKQCQSIRKSKSAKNRPLKDKQYYYQRLVDYCAARGEKVLETEWKTAKTFYHFKCDNPNHPVWVDMADTLYSDSHWCPYCSGRVGNFEKQLEELCNSKNGALLGKYIDANTPIDVKCNVHNYIWKISPNNLKKGRWCPICHMNFNEMVVFDYLQRMSCKFEVQYKFDDLIGNNNEKLKFDFAVFDENNNLIYLIEVDDEEHRYKVLSDTPRQQKRKEAQERDKIKNKYCEEHNIPLYRMEVPFLRGKRWSYEDYYRYINTELKFIVNLSRLGGVSNVR